MKSNESFSGRAAWVVFCIH